ERTRALSQFRLTQKVELDQLAQDHSADLASADDAGASQMAQIQQSADSEERCRRDAPSAPFPAPAPALPAGA
ncbi:MAG TPA: hypothetical protein VEB64_13570, partial [Azospirillaceae bacterium]|nr:hypothetical protein [Azospirillaceae bacterium]